MARKSRSSMTFTFVFVGILLYSYFAETPLTSKRAVDLGVAQYPLVGETEYLQKAHRWDLASARYKLTYRHGEDAVSQRRQDHSRLGRSFQYQLVSGDSFSWRNDPRCQREWQFGRSETWACVYTRVLENNRRDLEPIMERVSAGLLNEQMSAEEASRWLLNFVQTIPYKLPDAFAFGLLPPSLVVSENWGDCDSKSLLLIVLLRHLGIEAHMMVSQAHKHAMVAIPVARKTRGTFNIDGRRYAWAETTAEAPLGWIDPNMLRPNDWRVVWLKS